MFSFQQLSNEFKQRFSVSQFPAQPATLYQPANYFLLLGGKRLRPVLCIMANELFGDVTGDAWQTATAIELFHNFTLIHDDIMDNASLRRGQPTVAAKYGTNTAILSGDIMLIRAYECLNQLSTAYRHAVLTLFNRIARQVCEGQQLDMDFENKQEVTIEQYIYMIELKTAVLMGGALQLGGMLAGATKRNCIHLYELGKNLGIAFQIQDDYLDAFGNPQKFGKDVGGDIKQNKKTILLLDALLHAGPQQKQQLQELIAHNHSNKVEEVLKIFKACGTHTRVSQMQQSFVEKAYYHLEEVSVLSSRKQPLKELIDFLILRDH